MNKRMLKDSLFTGLAPFAMFFGAGNLVFPPSVGLLSGEAWVQGAIGLLISAVILPVTGIWSVNNAGGDIRILSHHIHPKVYTVFCFIGWIVGSMGSTLPRAAAITHEIGIQPLFPAVPAWVSAIVFFAIVYFLAKDQGAVVDRVGKYLTPVLVGILAIVLIKGIISPIGEPTGQAISNPFANAMFQGYVIGDLSIALMSANIFMFAVRKKGYSRSDEKKVLYMTGVVCVIVMGTIYGALTYIGATGSAVFPPDTQQGPLLVGIIDMILGRTGQTCMAVVVALACLTTAITIATSIADFFSTVFKGKITYRQMLIIVCVVCPVIATLGLTKIISMFMPIMMAGYPAIIVLTFLGLIDHLLPNDGAFKYGTLVALIFGAFDAILLVCPGFTLLKNFVALIPLGSAGFAWVIPSIIAMIVGEIVYRNVPRKYFVEEENK